MISRERAEECIGRSVIHATNPEVQGVVDKVTKFDVWVKTPDGERLPCIPENLNWKSTVSPGLRDAIVNGETYATAQVCYEHDEQLGVVFSPAVANDDDDEHLLFAILYMVRRVHRAWPTANSDTAWEIEEILGWKNP